ncbi:MAG: HD domain-containing protein [Firmicutes bacterium]|nr:HD domain-containing protein [Bacillota bacterium]
MNKEYYVNTLQVGEELTDFFMVKGPSVKIGSNHKTYFDITLCDKTGEVNGKKWDVDEVEASNLGKLKDGDIVKVRASVSEWNNIKQLRIARIRKADPEADGLEMSDYIKAAPEAPQSMYDFIWDKAQDITDEGLKQVCTDALTENKEKLMFYPGAMRNHHAEFAGLLYHTKRMLDLGIRACEVYTDLDKDWVICGVIMHDMEKLNEIESNELGMSGGYTMKGNLLGHIVLGTIRMEERAKKAGLSEEKTVMLQHMILAHHYEPEFGSPVRPMFPEAELLHYLDMLDAKMFDFEAALESVDGGHFSERVRTLDNRMIYKPSFK